MSTLLRYMDYLDHMIEAIKLAQSHVEGITKDDFMTDKKTQQAVIFNIIVICEAATKIADESPEFASAHPEVPWKQMRGMRNRMAHGYFEINLDVVWDTVQLSLPELAQQVLRLRT
jgi:uncharacterized protein with HEPN domain